MRIVIFLFTAAILHAFLLAFSYEGADQNVDEHLIGVALVQRQWEQQMATDGLKSQVSSAGLAKEEAAVKVSEKRQPDVTEEISKISVQEPVVKTEPPPPIAVEDKPVVMPDQAVRKSKEPDQKPSMTVQTPDKSARSSEIIKKATRIPLSPSVEPAEESTVQHEGEPTEAVPLSAQHPANDEQVDTEVETEQHAVAAMPSATTGQALRQAAPQQAQPRYGDNPPPVYPGIARRRGWEGTVEVNVKVLSNGRVAAAQIKNSSGYRSLDNAARKTILTWRFNPATRSGREIESWVVVPVHFILAGHSHRK